MYSFHVKYNRYYISIKVGGPLTMLENRKDLKRELKIRKKNKSKESGMGKNSICSKNANIIRTKSQFLELKHKGLS